METNKLILACLITLCSLPVAAQVKLGIEAGANLSNYITDSHSNPSDSKNMKVGFQAGLTVDYEFQNHLMLMSGLFFVRKGGNLKLGENYVSIRPRACFFPLFSFLPLWLHYNLNPLCVQY